MINRSASAQTLDIALPIVGEMTIYTLMNIIDLMIIGNYGGNKAVSAVGLSTEILITGTSILINTGLCVGITSLVSRNTGARKLIKAEDYAAAGIFLGLILAVLISCINFFLGEKLLFFAGARKDILDLSINFTKINSISAFFYVMINVMASIMRGYGNTKMPMIISFVTAVIKILGDLILVYGIGFGKMGINGSAAASIIAQCSGFIIMIIFINKKAIVKVSLKKILIINLRALKELFFLFLPSSMEEASFRISRLLCTFFIMYSGSAAFAANQIAGTIELMSVMPGIGFGMAATTLIGIKVGEKSYKEAKDITYLCAYWSVFMMSIFSLIFLFLSGTMVNAFLGDYEKDVIYLATLCLAIGAIEQPAIAVSFIFAGAMQGTGDTERPFIISFITSFFIRLPLMYYFIYINKCPVMYAWWITALQWWIDALLMYIMYKKRFKKLSKAF